MAKAVNFDLSYSIRCVFEYLTELACICTTVEMRVVYMNLKLRFFVCLEVVLLHTHR